MQEHNQAMMERFGFQFLGIPPKGELEDEDTFAGEYDSGSFQFLGIPPKGERSVAH